MDFTALVNFESPETGSSYAAGMSYTARDPAFYTEERTGSKRNAERAQGRAKALRDILPKWVSEGKVALGRVGAATVTAREG